jgi:hypothetical protein
MKTRTLIQALIISLLCIAVSAFAASSFTPNYNLELPAAGDTGWADALNSNFTEIDEQMFINQNSIQDHITDTVGAHAATAISTTSGSLVCTTEITVQAFLECLDLNLGTLTTGAVVTLNTDQTITGQKTFTNVTLLPGGFTADGVLTVSNFTAGLVHSDANGVLSSSLLVDADVDAAAAIAYSKLDLTGEILDADISTSAAISRDKLATGTAHSIAINDGSGDLADLGPLTNGQLVIGSTGGAPVAAAITGTSNQITVTNGAGSITLSTPQDIATSSDVTFDDITGTTSLNSALLKATGAGGIELRSNSNTLIGTLGASSGSGAVFEGTLETKTSLVVQDPGVGTNAVTIQSPTLSGNYTLTLPVDDGNANQVLGTDGSGNTSWVDATSGYSQNSDVTLTASDTIAIGTGNADRLQHWRVQGNSGPVTLSSTPFGTSPPQDRTIICLAGTSDANTVTIEVNDAADGVVGNGNVTLGLYESACFRYLLTEDRYIIESRSN